MRSKATGPSRVPVLVSDLQFTRTASPSTESARDVCPRSATETGRMRSATVTPVAEVGLRGEGGGAPEGRGTVGVAGQETLKLVASEWLSVSAQGSSGAVGVVVCRHVERPAETKAFSRGDTHRRAVDGGCMSPDAGVRDRACPYRETQDAERWALGCFWGPATPKAPQVVGDLESLSGLENPLDKRRGGWLVIGESAVLEGVHSLCRFGVCGRAKPVEQLSPPAWSDGLRIASQTTAHDTSRNCTASSAHKSRALGVERIVKFSRIPAQGKFIVNHSDIGGANPIQCSTRSAVK